MSKLRIGLFHSFMYARRPGGGELRGVAVELAGALGERLGDEIELVVHLAPPQVIEGLQAGACDIAFLGIDPVRGRDVDYAAPLMRADLTFLVAPGASARTIAEADQPGQRIAVVRNHTMETALRGKLQYLEPVYAATPDAAFELFCAGKADVSAGIRPGLIEYAARLPGSRVLEDRYGSNTIALAVLKGRAEMLAAITAFSLDARASGLAQRAIDTAGLRGVEVPDRAEFPLSTNARTWTRTSAVENAEAGSGHERPAGLDP